MAWMTTPMMTSTSTWLTTKYGDVENDIDIDDDNVEIVVGTVMLDNY